MRQCCALKKIPSILNGRTEMPKNRNWRESSEKKEKRSLQRALFSSTTWVVVCASVLWATITYSHSYGGAGFPASVDDIVSTGESIRLRQKNPTISPASSPQRIYNRTVFAGEKFEAKSRPKVEVYDSNDAHYNPPVTHFMDNVPSDGKGDEHDCGPVADWQTKTFPTCNVFHEMNIVSDMQSDVLNHIAHGGVRDVWMYEENHKDFHGKVIMKTLRTKMDFSPYNFEVHRIDALAFERLSASPFVLDIYGHCGHSVLNEVARGDLFDLHEDRKEKLTPLEVLEVSRDIAAGIAATHSIPGGGGDALLVHGDLAPSNLVLSVSGPIVKMNDYNGGILLGYSERTNSTCMYRRNNNCSPYRAPEECLNGEDRHKYHKYLGLGSSEAVKTLKMQSEKTDVYHLGNLMYYVYTGCGPYFCEDGPRVSRYRDFDERAEFILKGVVPPIPESSNPALSAVKWAIDKCRTVDIRDRPTAQQIADKLDKALAKVKSEQKRTKHASKATN